MEAVGTSVPSLELPVLRPRRSQISCRNSMRSLAIAALASHRRAAPSAAARKRDGRLFCSTETCPLAETLAGSASTSVAATAHEKVGVLLLNLGGPVSLQDAQTFLFNLFADQDIIRLPRLFRFV